MNAVASTSSPRATARFLPNFGTIVLAALTAFCIVCTAAFVDAMTTSRLLLALIPLFALQCLICPRLLFTREFAAYALFVGYLFLSLCWTPDGVLGMNTLFPAVDFLIVLVLLGSIFAFHDLRAATIGTLLGFFVGAGAYTYVEGFPFVYPAGFSYNGVAMIYVFGLFTMLVFGWVTRHRLLSMFGAVVIMAHIVATTSIKTNLGIVLGAVTAGLMFFRSSMRAIWRNILYVVLVVVLIGYAIGTNKSVAERVTAGYERVLLGLDVLDAREDRQGYEGFDEREYWMREGLNGWMRNPVFGYGVEAFRAKYGITSHSTPVDLLYNTGLVGFGLFYFMFASIGWRVLTQRPRHVGLFAIVLAGLICYLFMGLSGTVFYHVLIATYVAISSALLHRVQRDPGSAAAIE